jgi:hypothetical protein
MFVALQNLGCGTSLFDLTRCLWRPPETTGEGQVDGADTAKALQTQSITVIGNSGHYVIQVCGADSLQLGLLPWRGANGDPYGSPECVELMEQIL